MNQKRSRAAAEIDWSKGVRKAETEKKSTCKNLRGRSTAEAVLKEKQIVLPDAPTPRASYLPFLKVGNLVYLSGMGPALNGQLKSVGKVGADLTLEEAYQAAWDCGLNLLAQLKSCLGNLEQVKQIVQLKGYVNCTADFKPIPQVINGASDLMITVFGEKGKHTRCALGAGALPNNIPVEVEMIVGIYGE